MDPPRRIPWLRILIPGVLVLLVLGATGIWWLSRGLPRLEELERYRPVLSSRLLDQQGELIGEFFQQKRAQVPLEEISPWLIEALIAVEDRRFRKHWGVDLPRVASALLIDIASMSFAQGASTITQQLARNLYLSREKNLARKLREVLTAIQIERHYSKDEILEMYLTQAYFGHGAYGIQQAAQRFFGKDARDLDPTQSAQLVALLKAPRHFSPYHNPEAASGRRNLILRVMHRRGIIRDDQLSAGLARPLGVLPGDLLTTGMDAPYFSEYVRLQLEELQESLGVDIYRDGLEIQTTLDLRLQRLAEEAIAAALPRLDSISLTGFRQHGLAEWARVHHPEWSEARLLRLRMDRKALLEAVGNVHEVQPALVALDPKSGAIRAMVGGRDFEQTRFNRAVQAIRQPGSAFKPFLYTAAIDNGYPPSFRVSNGAVEVVDGTGKVWAPQNYDGKTGGLTTLREGLRESYNLVAVRLLMDVVPPEMVVRYARQMGISTPIQQDLAMALGSSGVIPLELVSAYACLANRGIRYQPFSVAEVRDRQGHVIWRQHPSSNEALSAGTAAIMTDLLAGVIDHGTGSSARWRYNFRAPAAGKTGTTNNYTDAWFVGYTPELACGVWVGNDDPQFGLGPGQAGGQAALPIWANFMRRGYEELKIPETPFECPETVVEVEICRGTYEPAGPFCPDHFTELFLKTYVPESRCPLHRIDF